MAFELTYQATINLSYLTIGGLCPFTLALLLLKMAWVHRSTHCTHMFHTALSLEVWYDGEGVRVRPGGVLWPAGAAALDEDVVLAGEGDGAERDDQEEVRHVRLHALPVQQVALLRAEAEEQGFVTITSFNFRRLVLGRL